MDVKKSSLIHSGRRIPFPCVKQLLSARDVEMELENKMQSNLRKGYIVSEYIQWCCAASFARTFDGVHVTRELIACLYAEHTLQQHSSITLWAFYPIALRRDPSGRMASTSAAGNGPAHGDILVHPHQMVQSPIRLRATIRSATSAIYAWSLESYRYRPIFSS